MRVLVTGATGAVGPVVVEHLVASGMTVRALVHSTPAVGLLPTAVELVTGDITKPDTLDAAAAGCDAIVHLAALLHINDPSPALRELYEAINVQGTANLLQTAQAQGVERFVFLSTIAVYGKAGRASESPLIDETTEPEPDSLYGETKLRAEALVLQARMPDDQPLGVVLRPAAIYGTRVKGNYQRLLWGLARGRFLPIGKGTNRRTLIYEHDLAAAVCLALYHPAAVGKIYNVTDGTTPTLHEIIAAICTALQRPFPRWTLPLAPVRLSVGLLEDGLRLVGCTSPIGQTTLDKYCEEIRVDGSRIQDELGFIPQTTLAAGWRAVAAELALTSSSIQLSQNR